jgi:hypothetical protein
MFQAAFIPILIKINQQVGTELALEARRSEALCLTRRSLFVPPPHNGNVYLL